MHFRTLVSEFRIHYCTAKKGDKGRLSKRLTNFVRFKKGRFLQKDEVDNLWYEVGDSRAHGKCAQALREGTADLMRQVSGVDDVPSPDGDISGGGKSGRPSSALTTSSRGSSSPATTINANSNDDDDDNNVDKDMAPRGGVMGSASRGMRHAAEAGSRVSPRCVTVGNRNNGHPQPRNGGDSGRTASPKRSRSPSSSRNGDTNILSPAGLAQGISATIMSIAVGGEHIVEGRTDALVLSEVTNEHSDDDAAVEDEHAEDPRRKRMKFDDEEPEHDYDYM
jgi:hypothetical protein